MVTTLAPILLLICLGFFALGSGYLPQVDPSELSYGQVSRERSIDMGWVLMVGLGVIGMITSAGLPAPRHEPWAGRGAISQAVGGIVVVCVTLLVYWFGNGFYFAGPADRCVYASCWPLREQTAALAAPTVIAGLLMLLAALLVRRVGWWIRAVGPAVVWVVLLLIQRAVYSSWLLPIFERPPS